jgi:hypothetical protein
MAPNPRLAGQMRVLAGLECVCGGFLLLLGVLRPGQERALLLTLAAVFLAAALICVTYARARTERRSS